MFENEKMYKEYIDGMDRYIHDLNELKKVDLEEAKEQARKSLQRSGILNNKGRIKSNICE